MPRLTEQEQQEIIRFVEGDKPLPDKYRFLLFEDKREVELDWTLRFRPLPALNWHAQPRGFTWLSVPANARPTRRIPPRKAEAAEVANSR